MKIRIWNLEKIRQISGGPINTSHSVSTLQFPAYSNKWNSVVEMSKCAAPLFFVLLQMCDPERWMIAEKVWRPSGHWLVATIINSDLSVDLESCFFIHTVKYILTVLYLHAALFLQFLLYYSNEVRWTILFNSGILYIFNTQLLGCSFTFCFLFLFVPFLFLLLRKPKCRCF